MKQEKRQNITEADKIHEQWYKDVEDVKTPEDAKKFIQGLMDKYNHGYGTIVHACTVAAIAGFKAMDNSEQGGITGFQAGCIGWRLIEEFMSIKYPAKILDYNNMLYPQYEHNFEKTIDQKTFDFLQEKAKSELKKGKEHVSPDVRQHWKDIVAGTIPFGYKIVNG